MIKVNGLEKYFGEKEGRFQVLKGVDLTIEDGDFVVLLGPSGSGKSTLLNCMAGLEKIDGGNVYYDETDISKLSDASLTKFRRDTVGFIFQQYYLLPNMTVEANVKMGADICGNKEYKEIIEAVGLKDKMKKYPSELSGGEQQRVSIARALAKRPKVLYLDEPTGALDEKTGREVLDFICKLKEKYNFTLVMVTHNVNIADMAHTVIKMNSGNISEIIINDKVKSAFEIGW